MNKIIYVGGFELPNLNAAAQRVTANGFLLKSLGFKITFIGVNKNLCFNEGIKDVDTLHPSFETKQLSYPKSKVEWIKTIFGRSDIIDYLKKNSKDTKYIILYNYPAIASIRIKHAMKPYGVEVISDITEWYSSRGAGVIFSMVKWIDTNLRIRFVAKGKVITTSQFMSDFYTRKGHEVLELPTLYDTYNFDEPYTTKNRTVTNFIYAGSPFDSERAKKAKSAVKERLDIVIESLIKLSNIYKFKFDIFGVTRDDYTSVYPEHSMDLDKLSNAIVFHGRKSHDVILSEIKKSDFSIFFRDESKVNLAGFPSKLAESISSGIPVITSNIFSLKKYGAAEGIMLSDSGLEADIIEHCLKMTNTELVELKLKTYNSRMFDYRKFSKKASIFFSN